MNDSIYYISQSMPVVLEFELFLLDILALYTGIPTVKVHKFMTILTIS